MGLIMDEMEDKHFNLRERLNVYTSAILGLAAPFLATRCLVYAIRSPQDWQEETCSWLACAALTVYPIGYKTSMIFTHHTLEEVIEKHYERLEIESHERRLETYDLAKQEEKQPMAAEQTTSQ